MGTTIPFSVLMSVYQKEQPAYLRECLLSLENQTEKPTEYVIVADGPLTQALDQELEAFKERTSIPVNIYQFEENRGLGEALADGVKLAQSPWIARMDTDDIARSDRFECQVAYLKEHPDVALLGSNVDEFMTTPAEVTAHKVVPESQADILDYAKRRNPFNHMTVMYRKDAVLAAGNYQPLPGYEDYYLWVRMLKQGVVAHNLQEALVYARADQAMYQRRGGFSYLRSGISAYNQIYRVGLAKPTDWLVRMAGQLVVNLMPNRWRQSFYQKALRHKKASAETDDR
ncbi:MAG: glycosyltransferase [Aerococcus sp.]|nr:glycosyltransferase [Aerococcus sp.]